MSAPTLAEKVAQAYEADGRRPRLMTIKPVEFNALAALVRAGEALNTAYWNMYGCQTKEADAWDESLSALASALGVSDAD